MSSGWLRCELVLSALNYHRWHSPVGGTIWKTYVVKAPMTWRTCMKALIPPRGRCKPTQPSATIPDSRGNTGAHLHRSQLRNRRPPARTAVIFCPLTCWPSIPVCQSEPCKPRLTALATIACPISRRAICWSGLMPMMQGAGQYHRV